MARSGILLLNFNKCSSIYLVVSGFSLRLGSISIRIHLTNCCRKDAYTNLRKIQASGACSHPSEALLITRIPQRVPGASFQSSEQLRSTQTSVASRIPRRKAECLDTSRSSETPIKIPKTKTPSAREHKAPAHLKDYVVVKSKQVVRSIPAPKTKASGSQTVVSEMTVTSSKPREKAIGGAYPYNVSMVSKHVM